MPVLPGRIAALVLAAGAGSRLGGGKLLLPWRGEPILAHVVRLAAACADETVVVVGCRSGEVREALARCDAAVRVVENPDWAAGQSGSLARGLAAIPTDGLCGVMVMLGDQPLVRPDTLDLLRRSHAAARARDPDHPATAPAYEGRRGNPVLLSPRLFPDVAALRGDVGARGILAGLGDTLLRVPVDDPGVVRDIDTPEDYRTLA